MEYDDPQARTLLANERTFLAWIRTALGLLGGSAVLLAIEVPWPDPMVRTLAGFLATVAGMSAYFAWRRWSRVEAAIFAKTPLPRAHIHRGLAVAVALVAVAVVFAVLVWP